MTASQETPWIALLTVPDGMLNYMWNMKMKCAVNDVNVGSFRTRAGPWDLMRIKYILLGVPINILVFEEAVITNKKNNMFFHLLTYHTDSFQFENA